MENTFENALDYVHHLDQIDEGWSESEKTLASAMLSYAAKVVKNCSIPDVVGQSEQLVCDRFEVDNITSSATKCKNCWGEKWQHTN